MKIYYSHADCSLSCSHVALFMLWNDLFWHAKKFISQRKRALLQSGMCFIEVLYDHNTLINSSFSYVDIFWFLRRKCISVLLIGLLG